MATKILYEFISERRMTITDSIERCLKKGWLHLWFQIVGNKLFSLHVAMTSVQKVKLAVCICKPGKGVEQCAAASLACLLCIQLGSGIESEEVFKTLKPVFKTILNDGAANIQARQAVSSRAPLLRLKESEIEIVTICSSWLFLVCNESRPLHSCSRRWYHGKFGNESFFTFKWTSVLKGYFTQKPKRENKWHL